jgi:hypothetical protein
MLYAIGLQESLLTHRFQVLSSGGRGPARGLWQFEAGGGVTGVMNHKATSEIARLFAMQFVGTINPNAVWAAIAYEDILAAVFARLLLWTDAQPLPPATTASQEYAWQYYIRNWRPGKPHPDKWPDNWRAAIEKVNNQGR